MAGGSLRRESAHAIMRTLLEATGLSMLDHVQNIIVRILFGVFAPKASGEKSADTNDDGVIDENDKPAPSQAEDEVRICTDQGGCMSSRVVCSSATLREHMHIRSDVHKLTFSQYGKQERLTEFAGLTEEYLDKMIELGYIMLFSAACPVLAAIALVCSHETPSFCVIISALAVGVFGWGVVRIWGGCSRWTSP